MCARYYPNGNNSKRKSSISPGGRAPTLEDNGFSDWLYNGTNGQWTKEDQDRFDRLYALPGYQQYFDYLLDRRASKEYFNHNQLTYGDVHDPRKTPSSASTSAMYRSIYRFVSDNVKKLYK